MPSIASDTARSFRPPAPIPRAEPLSAIALLRKLRDNPLEAWTRTHFESPVVIARLPFGKVAVISDPRAPPTIARTRCSAASFPPASATGC